MLFASLLSYITSDAQELLIPGIDMWYDCARKAVIAVSCWNHCHM